MPLGNDIPLSRIPHSTLVILLYSANSSSLESSSIISVVVIDVSCVFTHNTLSAPVSEMYRIPLSSSRIMCPGTSGVLVSSTSEYLLTIPSEWSSMPVS